jgi:photosystem II stability/assembly factor-like uncharacterized protein
LPGKIALFALVVLAAVSGAVRHDAWEIIGPGGGGAQFFPAINPQNPDDVFVACDMTGAYVSHDGGSSWRMFNLGQVVKGFIFDPSDSRTVYARSAGERADGRGGALWRSTDAADTWQLVYPDPSTVTGVFQNSDHGMNYIASSADSPGEIEALAVDPADSHVLDAVVRRNHASRLLVSEDWGKTWKPSADLDGGGRSLYIDQTSPGADRTVYVIGQNSVAVRQDGAWRRGPAPAGVSSFLDADLGFKDGKPVIYVVAKTAVFVSDDAGASWRESKLPGDSADLRAVATSANHGDVAYLSYSRLTVGGARYFGVAKTTDAGRGWTLVWQETSTQPAKNVHDGWITARLGPAWGENPLNLAVAAGDPKLCIATDMGRTMRTRDGGKTWEGVYSRRLDDQSNTTTGLDVTTNYGVHFDPFDRQRLFITYTDIGMFRSENGGRGWISATETVPRRWTNTTYWMVFDPKVRGRAWAVMSETHDLPRPKMWRNRSTARYEGGVVISDDGGRAWRVSNNGMPQTAATHILLDTSSPEDARVLYVTGFGRGVFKSTDGGKSWELRNDGLPQTEPFAWRLAQGPDHALYVVLARRSEDASVGTSNDGALYRSADAAAHWTKIALPTGVNGPNGIAIDPNDPARLYLAAWGRPSTEQATSGGIWISSDGGATWRNTLSKDQYVYDVTIDPRNPEILYACGFSSSAWRSTDRGETWKRIRGFNFKWGHRVIPDPYDPSKIYITTYGGSVWHGPAAGDPQAKEDIVTPEVAYGR